MLVLKLLGASLIMLAAYLIGRSGERVICITFAVLLIILLI